MHWVKTHKLFAREWKVLVIGRKWSLRISTFDNEFCNFCGDGLGIKPTIKVVIFGQEFLMDFYPKSQIRNKQWGKLPYCIKPIIESFSVGVTNLSMKFENWPLCSSGRSVDGGSGAGDQRPWKINWYRSGLIWSPAIIFSIYG
jgi:hypothetical protein